MQARIITISALLGTILAGCQAGSSFHGSLELGQFTPELSAAVRTEGDSNFDLDSTGNLENDESFWVFDCGVRLSAARSGQVGAYAFNLGYLNHTYNGSSSPTGLVFDGQDFTGATQTEAEYTIYKFTYEEPNGGNSGERTGGLIGFHVLDYDISARDSDSYGKFSGNAPMFVIGYKVSYYSNNLLYYLNVEWMDLNAVTLDNVQGEVMDISGGLRWIFDESGNIAISAGYRTYTADLDIKGDELSINLDGAYFGMFFMW